MKDKTGLFTKCCKRCNVIYKTPWRYSICCPNCDTSKNRIKRGMFKKIIKPKSKNKNGK